MHVRQYAVIGPSAVTATHYFTDFRNFFFSAINNMIWYLSFGSVPIRRPRVMYIKAKWNYFVKKANTQHNSRRCRFDQMWFLSLYKHLSKTSSNKTAESIVDSLHWIFILWLYTYVWWKSAAVKANGNWRQIIRLISNE